MKTLLPLVSLLAFRVCAGNVDWMHPLSFAERGCWPLRAELEVTNAGPGEAAGEPLTVPAGPLAGERAESIRVYGDGRELLYDLRDRDGRPRRSGAVAADDLLTVPVACAAGRATGIFAYAGNPSAWPMPEFLPSGFVNGALETGDRAPEGWSPSFTDATHRVSWGSVAGRGGSRGLCVEVDAGAPPTWVQWQQDRIAVAPGRTYEVRGWVRAENLAGDAGWYVHVNGERPQLVNRQGTVHGGTHDWTEIRFAFATPAAATGSLSATIGTILHGTGRAWFDDVRLSALEGGPALTARWRPAERLALAAPASAPTAAASSGFPIRVTVRAYNFDERPADRALVSADLRPAFGRWYKLGADARFRVLDAATGRAMDDAFWMDDRIVFPASLPARSRCDYIIDLAPGTSIPPDESRAAHGRLAAGPVNRTGVPNLGNDAASWKFNGDPRRCEAGPVTVTGSPTGRGVGFHAPSASNTAWIGWVSPQIPVRPGASYLYAAFVRTPGSSSPVGLHAHLHQADGKLVAANGMLGTRAVAAADEWTLTSTTFRAPSDAATVNLHLTMNQPGTLQHDGVLLCETVPAEVTAVAPSASAPVADLFVWQANPLVKVFRDDPAGPAAGPVTAECARRERECVQLVVRAGKALSNLRATVTPLRNAHGDTLPAAAVERVGYVPVDHPSGYFHDDAPAWAVRKPGHAGSTDGWAGMWPDPLIPAASAAGRCDVAAGMNQPFWITVRAEPGAAAGDYLGEIAFEADGAAAVRVPLTVRVLPFELPARPRLRAIFDLRSGPGGDYGSGLHDREGRRAWLRFLAEHRIGIHEIQPAPAFTRTDGVVRMDASAWDDEARFCLDELDMSVAYTPPFLYAFGWAYPPKRIFGLEPFTPEYNDAYRQAIKAFADHVRAKGWFDRFVYYISDEPHFSHDFVVEQMRKLCAMSHEAAPGLPIYSSTWRHCPAWDDSLDIWGVGQYGCFPVAEMERLRAKGRQMWFTCDGQMATDTPYLATERMLAWYSFTYGATCFEFWGVSWWTYDPWRFGWHTFISQSDDGQRRYWIRYPNGDGYLTYPGAAVGVAGPVSSIRMEQVREGLEDYEALVTLRDLAARSPQAAARAADALARARDLVVIPNAGGLRSTQILPDPDRLTGARRAVNAAIVDLLR